MHDHRDKREKARWKADELLATSSTTQQPGPWREGRHPHSHRGGARSGTGSGAAARHTTHCEEFYIRGSDIAQHGYTPGCKVCTALRLRKPPQGHTEACRERRDAWSELRSRAKPSGSIVGNRP